MPKLSLCSTCKREGGYAENEEDKVCFRCKKKMRHKGKPESSEEEEKKGDNN
jgi:hypothetical protein